MLKEVEMNIVKRIIDEEYEDSLSMTQIENINTVLEEYLKKVKDPNEFMLLLFTSRMKNTINNYVDEFNEYLRLQYTSVCDIEYSVKRTLANFYEGFNYRTIKDPRLEKKVLAVEEKISKYKEDKKREEDIEKLREYFDSDDRKLMITKKNN